MSEKRGSEFGLGPFGRKIWEKLSPCTVQGMKGVLAKPCFGHFNHFEIMLVAVLEGRADILEALCSYHQTEEKVIQFTLQQEFIKAQNAPVLKILGKYGYLDRSYHDGNTCAHVAAIQGNVDALRLIAEYGADLGKRNEDGNTCLDLANENTKQVIRELTLKYPDPQHWSEECNLHGYWKVDEKYTVEISNRGIIWGPDMITSMQILGEGKFSTTTANGDVLCASVSADKIKWDDDDVWTRTEKPVDNETDDASENDESGEAGEFESDGAEEIESDAAKESESNKAEVKGSPGFEEISNPPQDSGNRKEPEKPTPKRNLVEPDMPPKKRRRQNNAKDDDNEESRLSLSQDINLDLVEPELVMLTQDPVENIPEKGYYEQNLTKQCNELLRIAEKHADQKSQLRRDLETSKIKNQLLSIALQESKQLVSHFLCSKARVDKDNMQLNNKSGDLLGAEKKKIGELEKKIARLESKLSREKINKVKAKTDSLARRLNRECRICLEQITHHGFIFSPCGHITVCGLNRECERAAKNVKECLDCGINSTGVYKVFLQNFL